MYGNKCAKLNRHLYGTRGAAAGWETEYSQTMVELGFRRGIASGCLFHHPTKNLRCAVYGDDFTLVGAWDDLNWFEQAIQTKYAVTLRGRLGPAHGRGGLVEPKWQCTNLTVGTSSTSISHHTLGQSRPVVGLLSWCRPRTTTSPRGSCLPAPSPTKSKTAFSKSRSHLVLKSPAQSSPIRCAVSIGSLATPTSTAKHRESWFSRSLQS